MSSTANDIDQFYRLWVESKLTQTILCINMTAPTSSKLKEVHIDL